MTHLLYGMAYGGPYNGRPIAHHEAAMAVALDADSGRDLPGQIGPSVRHPRLIWKAYVWQPALEEWRWDDKVRRSETLKRD